MRKQDIFAAALLASGLFGMSVSARAQSSSQPPPLQITPSARRPSRRPLRRHKDKTKQGTTPPANPDQSATPRCPADSCKKPSTAADNPFPEDVSEKAAAAARLAANDASTPDAPTPATPTPAEKQAQGSSSLDNTDKLGLDDPEPQTAQARISRRHYRGLRPQARHRRRQRRQVLPADWLYKGAYDRFKDATVFDHENVEAVFCLAEAARKLNMAKEAEQNYQLYLAAVPDGPSAKAAKKALGELGSSSKP